MKRMELKNSKIINLTMICIFIFSFYLFFKTSFILQTTEDFETYIFYFELFKINFVVFVTSIVLNYLVSRYYNVGFGNVYLTDRENEYLRCMKKSKRYRQLYFYFRVMVVITIMFIPYIFFIVNSSFIHKVYWQIGYYIFYFVVSSIVCLIFYIILKKEKHRLLEKE